MRHVVSLILPFACLAFVHAQTTTLTLEKANNTSACAANGSPSYCVVPQGEQPALPLSTSTNNQTDGAQTTIADAFPGHVSTVAVGQLMNTSAQNWAGKVLCEYQPWFSLQTGYNGHIDIDYDENPDNTQNPYLSSVPNQDTVMISRGCNISFIDFYGQIDSSQNFNKDTTDYVNSD